MFSRLYQKYFSNTIAAIVKQELRAQDMRLRSELDLLKLQSGRILCNQARLNNSIENIQDAEFKIFSQWGDDGIIQYLIHKLNVKNKIFIEFGVEIYRESNTRFLLMNDNWKGLVIDGSQENINFIKKDELYWRYELTAVCSFITTDNINQLFINNGIQGDIGILSIDIDGNDLWVWDKINSVNADIVIVEYNSVFGSKHAITVPYDPAFTRNRAHNSNLYWGTSLKALCLLASKKGYTFVGCNSNGNNAYFVKGEKANGLKSLTAEEGFVESHFRESRDANGELTFKGGNDRSKLILDMPVFNVESNKTVFLRDLL